MQGGRAPLVHKKRDANYACLMHGVEHWLDVTPSRLSVGSDIDLPLNSAILKMIAYLLRQIDRIDSLISEEDNSIASDCDLQRVFSVSPWHSDGMICLGQVGRDGAVTCWGGHEEHQ